MNLPNLDPWQWAVAILTGFLVGISKSGLNGVGLIAALLMAQIYPAKASTGIILPMLITADVFAVAMFRRHAQWHYFPLLIPPALLGVVIGFWLMPRISEANFSPTIGWIVLLMIAIHYWRRFNPRVFTHLPESKLFAWSMGISAGITTMLANAAGPIMNIYLLARKLPKHKFVGTAAVYFLIVNVLKVPFSAKLGLINRDSLQFTGVLIPAVLLGLFVGKKLLDIIPQRVFEEVLLFFALVTALRMVI